jgi:hypothetical protein
MSPAYTPFPSTSSQDQDENEWWLRREISLIANLLHDEGETDADGIGGKLGCKYWGPMRFGERSRKARSAVPSARQDATFTRPRIADSARVEPLR